MKPGRELDQLIAEKVMGWDVNAYFVERPGRKHYFDPERRTFFLPEQWCPSENIEDAWEVVEKFPHVEITKGEEFACCRIRIEKGHPEYERPRNWVSDEADTSSVPLAICLAALKAVEGK